MTLNAVVRYDVNTTIQEARSVSNAFGTYRSQLKSEVDSADNIFTDASAIAGASVTYDMAGSLENSIGDPVIFGKINYIQLINTSTTSAITAFGAPTDIRVLSSAGSVISIEPGGRFNIEYPSGLSLPPDTITIRGTGATFELAVLGSDA